MLGGSLLNRFSLWRLAVCYRLVNCIVVQTWFVPDEYWQTLEPAHRLAFGYGYLTWEWQEALRGYSYPAIFAFLYRLLALLSLDEYWFLMVLVPKVFCCLFAVVADVALFKLAGQLFDAPVAVCTMLLYYGNWFQFFCAPRTLLNTVESNLVVLALHGLFLSVFSASVSAIFATLAVLVRPTSVLLLLPAYAIASLRWSVIRNFRSVLLRPICASLLVVAFTAIVDRICYGYWTLPVWNFFRFNFLQGGSALFGAHPWHWYFTSGLPTVLLFQLLPTAIGVWKACRKRQLFYIVLLYIVAHSFIAHKELRFLLPTVPLLCIYAAYGLGKLGRRASTLVCVLVFVPNVLLGLFTAVVHQRGLISVTRLLHAESQRSNHTVIWYLMPCHSTPYYSHVHANVSMRFLKCMPDRLEDKHLFQDEVDKFYGNPSAWFYRELQAAKPQPSHLVMFSMVADRMAAALQLRGYAKFASFFHTFFPVSDRQSYSIMVYKYKYSNQAK